MRVKFHFTFLPFPQNKAHAIKESWEGDTAQEDHLISLNFFKFLVSKLHTNSHTAAKIFLQFYDITSLSRVYIYANEYTVQSLAKETR